MATTAEEALAAWDALHPTSAKSVILSVAAELAQHLRMQAGIPVALEKAWDEGHAMGGRSPFFQTPNPYRKA